MTDNPISWTEGGFLDSARVRMEFEVNGAHDEVDIVPIRTQNAAILYVKQGSWLRMSAKDMHELGAFLMEGAAAFGYVPEEEESHD